MKSQIHYMAGVVVRDDLVFISSQLPELNDRGIDHTKVLRWKAGVWAHYMIDWPTISLAVQSHANLTVLALDPFGRVHVATGGTRTAESIDPSKDGPMREIRSIAGCIYAVGMQRQAYRRVADGQWHRFDNDAVAPLRATEVSSFDSIDGFGGHDLYAAGLDGAIWHWNGRWHALDSPTSAGLEKVLCTGDGRTIVAGQLGTLIEGRESLFRIVDTGQLKDTIWDLAWFRGAIYASTLYALYRFDANGFARVDTGLPGHDSFANLSTNGTSLWSIGRTQLARTVDGLHWQFESCTDFSY